MPRKVIVNSYPRTANIFFLRVMHYCFGYEDFSKIDPRTLALHNKKLLYDKTAKQVSILRNPEKAIVSYKILVNHRNPEASFTLEDSCKFWIDWHNSLMDNLDHIYPLLFEQATTNTLACLQSIADSEKISMPNSPALVNIVIEDAREYILNSNEIASSSRSDSLYEKEEFLGTAKELLEEAIELYEVLKTAILKKQQSLAWNL